MRAIIIGLTTAAIAAITFAAPASAADTAATATTLTPPEAKKICRASVETGSLIKKRKTCLTKAQWVAVDDQHEREAHKMIEDNTGKPQSN